MRSSVTVTGPPAAIWRRKIGTTEPDEPSTLPNRTVEKRVSRESVLRRFDRPLGERLRRAHHGLGRDRLVGRHEHEALRARLARRGRDDPRGHGVVAHRLDRVLLHQRHVLVGRGVEHDARAVLLEDLAHAHRVAAVGEHGRRAREVALLLELAPDLEERVLRVLHEDQPLAARRARSGGRARSRSTRRRRSRARSRRSGTRRRGRSRPAPARARERPPPGPRGPDGRARRRRASSSKVVGSVRTGMPRPRQAVTTFCRSMPGADGIAITTSSGPAASSTRSSSSVAPSTFRPPIRCPCLRGSSSTKPIGTFAQLRVAAQLRQHLLAAVARADDQHLARVGARSSEPRAGRSTIARARKREPGDEERASAGSRSRSRLAADPCRRARSGRARRRARAS